MHIHVHVHVHRMCVSKVLDLQRRGVWSVGELDVSGFSLRNSVHRTRVSSLKNLAACTTLTRLDVSHSRVCDLVPMQHLGALRALWLKDSWVESLMGLEECKQLRLLDLTDTRVSSLWPLCCESLRALGLGRTLVRDLSPLESCKRLETLDLSAAVLLSTLTPLTACHKLCSLNLSGLADTAIDFSVLAGFPSLSVLRLDPTTALPNSLPARIVVERSGAAGIHVPRHVSFLALARRSTEGTNL